MQGEREVLEEVERLELVLVDIDQGNAADYEPNAVELVQAKIRTLYYVLEEDIAGRYQWTLSE